MSKLNNNSTQPPDSSTWIADECSKILLGCKLRLNNIGSGTLPFGGYPSVNRFR